MGVPEVAAPVVSTAGQLLSGARLLLRGLGMYARSPRLVFLGIVPALITGVLYTAGFAALLFVVDDLAALVTPFADGWSGWVRDGVRLVAALALLGLAWLIGVLTFTAVTLLVGDPFYEAISLRVENRYGGVPDEVELPWWLSLRRSVADSVRLIARSVLIGLPLFACGFIPVVGQLVVPVVGAAVGGWFLALELVGAPFNRRGLRLPARRRMLRAHRPVALGFGVAVFLCFLIPLGAVLVMPAAVAGGALLARRSLGLPVDDPRPGTGGPPSGRPAAAEDA